MPLVLALSANCGGGAGPDTGQVIVSGAGRLSNPSVSSTDLAAFEDSNLDFATSLWGELSQSTGNLAFSPTSISMCLAMSYAGAANSTASQIATVAHFVLPPQQLHQAFDDLDLTLGNRPSPGSPSDFSLSFENAVWGQRGLAYGSAFLDILAKDYGTGVRTVDFVTKPEESRIGINYWVSNQTKGEIPNLIPVGAITSATRMILTNTVTFEGKWLNSMADTQMIAFHADTGDVVVPTVMTTTSVHSWSGNGWQAADLPYIGQQASMIVVVPDLGTLSDFQGQLSRSLLTEIMASESGDGEVILPKFNISTTARLAKVLATMGMVDAFDPTKADFSGIDGAHDMSMADVVHSVTLSLDKNGTTASGATGITFIGTSARSNTLLVNRPFLFFVWDRATRSVLFAGRIVNPSE